MLLNQKKRGDKKRQKKWMAKRGKRNNTNKRQNGDEGKEKSLTGKPLGLSDFPHDTTDRLGGLTAAG